MLPQIARGDSNKMWVIPSELTDALRGIGGSLGSKAPDLGDDDEGWVEPDRPDENPFDDTILEDPAQALKEARGQAGQASREATEHATPVGRVQPSSSRGGDVPDPTPASAPPAAPFPADPAPTGPAGPPPGSSQGSPPPSGPPADVPPPTPPAGPGTDDDTRPR